jgi:hypothetical protein
VRRVSRIAEYTGDGQVEAVADFELVPDPLAFLGGVPAERVFDDDALDSACGQRLEPILGRRLVVGLLT